MKRLTLLGFIGMMAGLLAGCPIYPNGEGGGGGCEFGNCPPPNPNSCASTADCGINETCGKDNEAWLAWHSVATLFYIIERQQSAVQARHFIRDLLG